MSRRSKVVVTCTITMLIVSGVIQLVAGKDDWLSQSISAAILYGFGIWFGYTQGMKD